MIVRWVKEYCPGTRTLLAGSRSDSWVAARAMELGVDCCLVEA
jgi:hypothetical protein